MVFGECQTLGVPIVSTDTISAKELVEERNIGMVCPNDEDGVYTMLKTILQGQAELEKYVKDNGSVNYSAKKQLCSLLQDL